MACLHRGCRNPDIPIGQEFIHELFFHDSQDDVDQLRCMGVNLKQYYKQLMWAANRQWTSAKVQMLMKQNKLMLLANGSAISEPPLAMPIKCKEQINRAEIRRAFEADELIEPDLIEDHEGELVEEGYLPDHGEGVIAKLLHGGLPNAQVQSNKACLILRRFGES